MAGYNTSGFADCLLNSLAELNKDKLNVMMPQNKFYMVDEFMKQTGEVIEGGTTIQENWIYDVAAKDKTKRYFKSGTQRQGHLINNTVVGNTPIFTGGYDVSYIEEQILANRKPAKIVDELKRIRVSEHVSFLTGMDGDFWGVADETSGVATQLFGIPEYIVPITAAQISAATTLGGSFQGANRDGRSDMCGVDLSDSTYASLRNYNAAWTNSEGTIASTDRVRIAELLWQMDFKAPDDVKELDTPPFKNKRIYTNDTMWQQLGVVKEQLNDNIGADITKYHNSHFINGITVRRVKELETASTTYRGYNPMYFINLDLLRFRKDAKKWMRHNPVQLVPMTTDSFVEYVDIRGQMMPIDPQKCGAMINWNE